MWKTIRRIIYVFFLLNFLMVFWCMFFNPPITITQIQNYFVYHKLKRDYIDSSQMGTNIKKAIIASEDQNFYQHSGFDFDAIDRALEKNKNGKRIFGGSTISQQTAKNVFLWQQRSWVRKGLEVFYTFAIELLWSKDTILERYLNSIEMGQGVFGIQAASQYYFHKPAMELTKSEAAWIATVLPNPKKYDPKNPSLYLQRKHKWILEQMNHIVLE